MKSAVQYIVLFGGLFLLSSTVVVALLVLKPELFQGQAGDGQSPAAAADSLAKRSGPIRELAGPTLAELQTPDSSAIAVRDTIVQLQDSLQQLAAQLQQERQKSEILSRAKPAPVDSLRAVVDTAKVKERKNFAKVLESMPAENAARILQDLPDAEMKEILMNVKKRQAAKILSAIEPSRASKLFR